MRKFILSISSFVVALSCAAQVQIGADIDGEALDDLSGYSVSMGDANTVAIGAPSNDESGDFAGHVRVYTLNDNGWQQKGSDIDGEAEDNYSGQSVSMGDANTVAIGAYNNGGNGDKAGHVRVYRWDGNAWQQKGGDIDGEAEGDQSGYSVSMADANTVAIGAIGNNGSGDKAGHVRVYTWNGSAWVQIGSDIDGEDEGDYSGWSVSMGDANTVAIGAYSNDEYADNAGHVRVYRWDGSTWQQKGTDIDGEAEDDYSGYSVSMADENTVAIGAPLNGGNGADAGHVRVFHWDGSAWQQKGADMDGEAKGDQSGYSVSMGDANTVAIAAYLNEGTGSRAGHVRVYRWNSDDGIWTQVGADLDAEEKGDYSGWSVSMANANMVAVGAPYNNGSGNNAGQVRVYDVCATSGYADITSCGDYTWEGTFYNNSGTYTKTLTNVAGCDSVATLHLTISCDSQVQIGQDIDGEAYRNHLGISVSMGDARTVAIGAPGSNNGINAGYVRVYRREVNTWVQKGGDIDGEAGGDRFGHSVSMGDANTVAIGAPRRSLDENSVGKVRVYRWVPDFNTWVQIGADIDGEAAGDRSGQSVSMGDANTLAIGAHSNDEYADDSGKVRVYRWDGSGWVQKGADINGESEGEQSGFSVSMPDANTVAIGAYANSENVPGAGQVRVYRWDGEAWVQKGSDIDGEAEYGLLGWSVSMPNANTVAIGASSGYYEDKISYVRVYRWDGSVWRQKGADIDGEKAGDRSGWSVSMPDANTLSIGDPENSGTATHAGHVRVYRWDGSAWQQRGGDIDGEGYLDESGWSVSMADANTVAIGAPFNSGNKIESGHVRVYDLRDKQKITFEALNAVTYGDPAFDLAATITSGLAVSYTSSDESVATISVSTVTIVGAGITTITASQAGDENHHPAPAAEQVLTVQKATLNARADDKTKIYGDANPELTITYEGFVNGDDVGDIIAPSIATGADQASDVGDYTITLSGGDADNYSLSLEDGTLTITPATITEITFEDGTFTYDGAEHSIEISGTLPPGTSVSYDDNTRTNVGSQEVRATISGSNYQTLTLTATLEVRGNDNQQEQTITFDAIDDQLLEDGTLILGATASSGLDVIYEIVSGPATVNGDTVAFTGTGTITVRASQAGNGAFLPATPVERSFEVITVTALEDNIRANVTCYPNPATDRLFIDYGSLDVKEILLMDLQGRMMIYNEGSFNSLDVSRLKTGVYVLKIFTDTGAFTARVIKK